MNSVYALVSAGLASLLVGCSSTPIALAPVGPNPVGLESGASKGELEVFSRLVEQSDDQNQGNNYDSGWYQHTDYRIYTPHGKLVRRVDNAIGHYEQAPRRVALPSGWYLVKAQAKDYLRAEVPVLIEPGRTTRVHLDDNWSVPAGIPKRALVSMPNGNPVGWHAESTKG